MSYTFTAIGNSSELTTVFYPPIQLDSEKHYEIKLLNFESYHSIPNVSANKNAIGFYSPYTSNNEASEKDKTLNIIRIATGAYEIDSLSDIINSTMQNDFRHMSPTPKITIRSNPNTMKTELLSNVEITFDVPNSIASLLGFARDDKLLPMKKHISTSKAKVLDINIIRIECNIATGSFVNGHPSHSIYEFFPTVSPGYKISLTQVSDLYLPVINPGEISVITFRIVDQDGNLVDFRGENIAIRVHIRSSQNGAQF